MSRFPVFLSWSGPRSRAAAEALNSALPRCIQQIRPWISSESVRSGTRWFDEIGTVIGKYRFCIAVMTEDNGESPWIHFEAGAVAKEIGNSYVVPYLVGISTSQLQGPLRQFNAVSADRDGTKRLVDDLNQLMGDDQIAQAILDDAFEAAWPELEKALGSLPDPTAPPPPPVDETVQLDQIARRLDGIEAALNRRAPKALGRAPKGDSPIHEMLRVLDNHGVRVLRGRQTDASSPLNGTFEVTVNGLPDPDDARALDADLMNRDMYVTLFDASDSKNQLGLGIPF